MIFRFLIKTIKGLIVNAENEWQLIHSHDITISFFYRNLILPLILLVSISAFLGSLLFVDTGLSVMYSVLTGLRYFILLNIVVFGSAYIFMHVARLLNSECQFVVTFRIIAGTLTLFLVCQIISLLFESFIFINILAFYGLYIGWEGIQVMLRPAENRKLHLLLAEVIIIIAVFLLSDWALASATEKIYYSFFS